jgi:quercetin dioxygenase-like cupin family protein
MSTNHQAPIRLTRSAIVHLGQNLALRVIDVDDTYWEHRDASPELSDGRVLSVFHYTGTWTWWERHPDGDELAYLLEGAVEVLLDDGVGRDRLQLLPGESAIVPSGSWHSVSMTEPATILFVTPTPARTQHRPVLEGDEVLRGVATAPALDGPGQ